MLIVKGLLKGLIKWVGHPSRKSEKFYHKFGEHYTIRISSVDMFREGGQVGITSSKDPHESRYYLVMSGRKGLMRRGASVCPRKMLAAAFMDSQAVVPTVTANNQPSF